MAPYSRGYRSYGPGVRSYNYYYGSPYYPWFGSGLYGGFYYGNAWGWGYPGWGAGYGYSPYWAPGYAYAPYAPVIHGRITGGVRLSLDVRDAQVFVDGAYAGVVDDFDGTLQRINLEPGPHRIDIEREGFEPVSFDVNVEPGRTITYRTQLHPTP